MKKLRLTTKYKQTLEKIIQNACKSAKVKGASYAIVGSDKVYFSHHYGTVNEDGKPNDHTQHMMIGSNTKILTALAILKLHDEKKLNLDEDIKTYLPQFKIKSRIGDEPITIRHLLMHRSGLPGDDFDLITNADKTLHDTLDVLKDLYRTAKPNTMYAYSNLGYALLGLIIESVSSMTYQAYLDQHIFRPLNVSFKILETKEKRARYKDVISQAFTRKGEAKEDPLSTLISAGSSTYSTLDDMVKLMQFFMNKDPQNLLRKDTIKMMLDCPDAVHKQVNSERIGLGLRHRYYQSNAKAVGPVYGHGGNTILHHSTFDIFPKLNIGFIAMTNSELGAKAIQKMNQKIMIKIFKLLDIRVPRRINTCKRTDKPIPNALKQSFLSPGLNFFYKPTKKGTPRYKLHMLSFGLTPCHDGFYQARPMGIIARLPLVSRMVKGIRIRPESVDDKTVIYLEFQRKHHKVTIPLASQYEAANITDAWTSAIGRYKPTGSEDKESLFEFAQLKAQKDDLVLVLKLAGQVMQLYLSVVNDKEAIIQGYGRNAKDTVLLTKKDDETTLTVFGLSSNLEQKNTN